MTLEQFMEAHEDEMFALNMRDLGQGAPLNGGEKERLARLNARLESCLPKPTPLPQDVLDAMEKVRALVGGA